MAAWAAALPLLFLSSLTGAGALRLAAEEGHQAESEGASVRHINGMQIQYPRIEASVDPEVVQAVYVACGGHACDLGQEAVRSFLAQAKLDGGKKPSLHLFVDEACATRMKKLQQKEPILAKAADVKIYVVSELKQLSTALNLYKQCASLRLSLPRLLPHLSKVLYMDTDTYVAGSLQPLWQLSPYLWAFGENDLTWYLDNGNSRCPHDWARYLPEASKDVRYCFYGKTGLNSGVMLLNQDTWRRLDMDNEVSYWVEKLTDHGNNPKVLMMGDQDIFNILASVHAKDNYTTLLSCEMNSIFLNRYMCFFGTGDWASFHSLHPVNPTNATLLQRNTRQPIIVHAKFNINRKGEHCWTHLHEQLFDAVGKVSRGEAGGARSICEVAGGCDLN